MPLSFNKYRNLHPAVFPANPGFLFCKILWQKSFCTGGVYFYIKKAKNFFKLWIAGSILCVTRYYMLITLCVGAG
jgi:hypothetical protein